MSNKQRNSQIIQGNYQIQVNNIPFESPKRISALKNLDFKSTTAIKSPFSNIFQDLEPILEPILLKTPRQGIFEEMIFFRTPDNRLDQVQSRLAEKLDFDNLGGSARKQLDVMQGNDSIQQYGYSYEEDEDCESVLKQEIQPLIIQIPANILWSRPNLPQNISVTNNKNNQQTKPQKMCCNCKKSRCLKLYCQCFRNNQLCSGCNCVACLNIDQHNPERYKAFIAMIEANPQAFCPKIQSQKHTKGCNCKKSSCLKKYCQCYQAGLPCTDLCKCQQCKNNGGDHCGQKYTPKAKVNQNMIQS